MLLHNNKTMHQPTNDFAVYSYVNARYQCWATEIDSPAQGAEALTRACEYLGMLSDTEWDEWNRGIALDPEVLAEGAKLVKAWLDDPANAEAGQFSDPLYNPFAPVEAIGCEVFDGF